MRANVFNNATTKYAVNFLTLMCLGYALRPYVVYFGREPEKLHPSDSSLNFHEEEATMTQTRKRQNPWDWIVMFSVFT